MGGGKRAAGDAMAMPAAHKATTLAAAWANTGWHALSVPPSELRIDLTLACGQSFRWKPTGPSEWYAARRAGAPGVRDMSATVLTLLRKPAAARWAQQ